jgi:hypothetical protein
MKQTKRIEIANAAVLRLLNDMAAMHLLRFLPEETETAPYAEEEPNDFPNWSEESHAMLAADLEESYTYFKNGGKGYSLEETVAYAREKLAQQRQDKHGKSRTRI